MCEWTDEWTLNISTCTHTLTYTFTSTSICITEYNSQRGRQRTKAEKQLSVSSARVHWVTLFDRATWRMSAACGSRGGGKASLDATVKVIDNCKVCLCSCGFQAPPLSLSVSLLLLPSRSALCCQIRIIKCKNSIKISQSDCAEQGQKASRQAKSKNHATLPPHTHPLTNTHAHTHVSTHKNGKSSA